MFYLALLIFLGIVGFIFRYFKVVYPFSKSIGIVILINIMASLCLIENVISNLDPVANDGLGISNRLAYLIIGEDGWSQETFVNAFYESIYSAFISIVVYIIVVVVEANKHIETRR